MSLFFPYFIIPFGLNKMMDTGKIKSKREKSEELNQLDPFSSLPSIALLFPLAGKC